MMPLELLGVAMASRHHRRAFGEAQIGLTQLHPVLRRHAVEPLDRRIRQLRVGGKRDVLGLYGGVDRNPCQVLSAQGAYRVRYAQALGQQQLQLVAQSLAPMAQIRALMREDVLEKLLTGEVLEIGIADPAFAYRFVGQPLDVLEQQ
jgi:hypothetical protein